MRSKLGTRSRLAAHILAFVLLILVLVYTSPETRVPESQPEAPLKPTVSVHPASPVGDLAPPASQTADGTLDRVHTPAVATRVNPEELRPPSDPEVPRPEPSAEAKPGIVAPPPESSDTLEKATPVQPHSDPLRPPANTGAFDLEGESGSAHIPPAPSVEAPEEEAGSTDETVPPPESESGSEAAETAVAATPSTSANDIPAGEPDPGEGIVDMIPSIEAEEPPRTSPEAQEEGDEVAPPRPQPDESGSLVVSPSETGTAPVAATTPITNANLEVLGDGVYWLDPRHNLETELAAVPELRTLILLTPLPHYQVSGFEHIKTEIFAADPADLTSDAADRFTHLTAEAANRPVVVAVLPSTLGAAFFKGVFYKRNRNFSEEEMLEAIEPELADAGEAREDITHRLKYLKD